MTKVRRQNISEEYSTTAEWLSDFNSGINKNADFLSNLKAIMDARKGVGSNKFSSIDEKMADIKSRVGYDIVKNVDNIEDKTVKSASCACSSCKTCDVKESYGDDAIEDLRVILKYIDNLILDRPEVSAPGVVQHCREHPGLNFANLEDKLDNRKLMGYINEQLSGHKTPLEAVEYISDVDNASMYDDEIADYMMHSLVSG
tara:strand:+ start:1616 stop:2218 length:603 start_codon:yes stop_codon:yes gene_type:complete